jgi:hypothetical protein
LERNIFAPTHPNHRAFLDLIQDPVFKSKHIEMPPLESDRLAGKAEPRFIQNGLGYSFFSQGTYQNLIAASNGINLFAFNGTDFETDFFEVDQGYFSRKIVATVDGFMGFGFFHDHPYDISQFNRLNITLKSGNSKMTDLFIFLRDGSGEVRIKASDIGFKADGEFQQLQIPLLDFSKKGIDLKKVTSSFGLVAEGIHAGDYFYVNDLNLSS